MLILFNCVELLITSTAAIQFHVLLSIRTRIHLHVYVHDYEYICLYMYVCMTCIYTCKNVHILHICMNMHIFSGILFFCPETWLCEFPILHIASDFLSLLSKPTSSGPGGGGTFKHRNFWEITTLQICACPMLYTNFCIYIYKYSYMHIHIHECI